MTYRVPRRLARVVDDQSAGEPVVYLMQLPDGDPLILQGSGGLIWALAADGESDVPRAVARAVGVPVEEIVEEVGVFLADLVERGLLVSGDAPGDARD